MLRFELCDAARCEPRIYTLSSAYAQNLVEARIQSPAPRTSGHRSLLVGARALRGKPRQEGGSEERLARGVAVPASEEWLSRSW